MKETEMEKEKVFLVAVSSGNHAEETERLLDELEKLAETAGAETVGRKVQMLPHPDPVTYLGSGKAEETGELARSMGADVLLADDELSPGQLHGLEMKAGLPVIDRTMVILDIFARHARTRESMIQVELAALEYSVSRLTGKGKSLSRQGGGIGTRGPGEKKLEQDKRLIRSRIARLQRDLREVEEHRRNVRNRREKAGIHHAAIVGYTNAGKSTLLNVLTGSDVLSEDKLFATLDTATRVYTMPEGERLLITDTVGFIRKLPHHLVKAFRSTLEEANYADILIHVVDASSPERDEEMRTVYETLDRLGIGGKKILTIFNKMDLAPGEERLLDPRADAVLSISAKTEEGISGIPEKLQELLREKRVLLEEVFSYKDMELVDKIRREGELIREEYREDGVYVNAYVPERIFGFAKKIKKN